MIFRRGGGQMNNAKSQQTWHCSFRLTVDTAYVVSNSNRYFLFLWPFHQMGIGNTCILHRRQ